MDDQPALPPGPYLTAEELGARWGGRTANAIKILRHRRRAPKGYVEGGKLLFPLDEVEAWEAAKQAADSRFNTALDPTKQPVQTRRSPRRKTAEDASAAA